MMRLSILGSTGSIGRQALDVVQMHPDRFRVVALAAGKGGPAFLEQARIYQPELCALSAPEESFAALTGPQWALGEGALLAAATHESADAVLVCVVGSVGLRATLAAIAAGKRVLLANKETLVAGGELVMALAREKGSLLLPVDSEHSAIFQCLQGTTAPPQRLILTASGGPFRTFGAQAIQQAGPADALLHPNWKMGPKITVDCASLMNKGLEMIEAHHLFSVPAERIDVVVHPQSIVHSLVQFADGAMLAQLGVPDMRVPIAYAMSYPERLAPVAPAPDLAALGSLTFEKPDTARFPCLRLSYEALAAGGTAPAVLSAANEEAVALFLRERFPFGRIAQLVEDALAACPAQAADSLDAVLEADRAARDFVARALAAPPLTDTDL